MMLFFWKFSYLTKEFLKLESDLDLKWTWKYQTSTFPKFEKPILEPSKPNPKVLLQKMGNFSFVIGMNLEPPDLVHPPKPNLEPLKLPKKDRTTNQVRFK